MKNLFSLKNSLELLAAIITTAALLGVLQSFLIGKHFVIPTMVLFIAILFGNLARFGLQGQRWAKHVLFWMFFLASCHLGFALFWAKTPREMLGQAFIYVYGAAFVIFSVLSWLYARHNGLFGDNVAQD